MVDIPKEAKKTGVRIRWWQPKHEGHSRNDWAIDGVTIGGKDVNPNEIKDAFSDGPKEFLWIQRDNVNYGEYCHSKYAVSSIPSRGEHVALATMDVRLEEGYMLQFSISVGCDASWDADIAPVHLQYSTDYGMTWKHLVQQCLSFYPQCQGNSTMPSIYYANKGWRRVIIPLNGDVVSK